MHDTLPIAYLIDPELFQFRDIALLIDTSESESRGQTVPGPEHKPSQSVKVAMDVDEKAFLERYWRTLKNI